MYVQYSDQQHCRYHFYCSYYLGLYRYVSNNVTNCHAVHIMTQALWSACRRSEQWYGPDKGYVTVDFIIVIILPLATKRYTQLPQIIQLSFLLQARLHVRILQQHNRSTKITTLGREQVFREHIYPVNIIHALIHSRLRYDNKWYFGSGHDVSPSIQTLMKSNRPTHYSLLLLDLYVTFTQSNETVHVGCLFHWVRQGSVNLPFLLTLLWFEAPFAKASHETYTSTNSIANIFVILLEICISLLQHAI